MNDFRFLHQDLSMKKFCSQNNVTHVNMCWIHVIEIHFDIEIRSHTHVNMKRKIDALKRDFIIKRIETQSKTFFRRMQTRFDMRPIDMRLKMF